MKTILFLLLFFPLIGAIYHALMGRRSPRPLVEGIACGSVAAAFVMAAMAMYAAGEKSYLFTFLEWFRAGGLTAAMDVYYNPPAAVMALMVTFVSFLIHVYAVGYMRHDEGYARFFCFLNLFVFFMLVITLADNLFFLFLGWEGVGFCSYALIGFWYQDPANATAGRKAFLLTRIGDVAFGIALGVIFLVFDSFSIFHLQVHAGGISTATATLIALLFLWAAVGKSAQLPLSVWLPDAMAGPTPVSALIHAATMVTAGVYLLIRFLPILVLSQTAMIMVALVGVLTAFYGACAALAQNEIKRVLAYSTIGHLGFMFLALGAADVTGSLAYLLSHAFSKSLLFLGAGCVIQALHEENDIFRMGKKVRQHLPMVFLVFTAGILSLGDIPPSSGFFAKDRILTSIFLQGGVYRIIWGFTLLTGFITVLSTFRLLFLVFTGDSPAAPVTDELHPVPGIMQWTLWPLALLALGAGAFNLPPVLSESQWLSDFLAGAGQQPEAVASHALEWRMMIGDGILVITALLLSFFLFGPIRTARWRKPIAFRPALHEALFQAFYLDRLYGAVFLRPFQRLAGTLWRTVDEGGLDRFFTGSGRMFPFFSLGLRLWTSGRLSTYLGMTFLGLALILAILFMEMVTG